MQKQPIRLYGIPMRMISRPLPACRWQSLQARLESQVFTQQQQQQQEAAKGHQVGACGQRPIIWQV